MGHDFVVFCYQYSWTVTAEQLALDSEHQRKIVPMESLTERRKVATSQPVAANVVHISIAPKHLVLKLREPEKMVPKGKTQGKNRGHDLAAFAIVFHGL